MNAINCSKSLNCAVNSADLDNSVHVGHSVEHWFPLRHVGNIQEILGDTSVGAFQASFDALRRLIGELN